MKGIVTYLRLLGTRLRYACLRRCTKHNILLDPVGAVRNHCVCVCYDFVTLLWCLRGITCYDGFAHHLYGCCNAIVIRFLMFLKRQQKKKNAQKCSRGNTDTLDASFFQRSKDSSLNSFHSLEIKVWKAKCYAFLMFLFHKNTHRFLWTLKDFNFHITMRNSFN